MLAQVLALQLPYDPNIWFDEDRRTGLNWPISIQQALREARLDGAYLRDADLSGADLFEVSLLGVNLNRANLTSAKLEKANLERGACRCEFDERESNRAAI